MKHICSLITLALSASAQIPVPTDAPKPMTPEESAAAFKVPDGFRMEVVASEPLIASPSAVCWDERGRMFVSELHGYNLEGQLDIEDLNKSGQLDTQVRRVQAAEKFKKAAESGTFSHNAATTYVAAPTNPKRPLNVTAYYSDGATRLAGATVYLDSWNGQFSSWSQRASATTCEDNKPSVR